MIIHFRIKFELIVNFYFISYIFSLVNVKVESHHVLFGTKIYLFVMIALLEYVYLPIIKSKFRSKAQCNLQIIWN